MEMDPQLVSPINPHFFQPLVPGFDTHLKIPVAFFSKYIEGKRDQTTAKLTSDASDKTWEVKLHGRRLTEGWKDFTTAHALRIGDVVIFKHQGDMVFHVTPLGPSCCEIQYTQPQTIKEEDKSDDDNENENRNVLRKKKSKPKTEVASSSSSPLSYNYCFVAEVTDSNLKFDTLNLPVESSSSIALNKRRFRKIIAVNEEGISWTLKLKYGGGCYYIKGGWRRFCCENRYRVGDLITFNLVGDGETTPLLCICPEENCVELINEYKRKDREEKMKKRKPVWKASPSGRKNRFVTITLTRYNIQYSKLLLPVTFVKCNGIDKHEEIVLMDKGGGRRSVRLIQDGPKRGRKGLGQGWKPFCEANDVFKPDESFVLELIWEGSRPVLKFRYKVKNE